MLPSTNTWQHFTAPPQTSGAVWKLRWPGWAPVPNKPTVSVDVKQLFNFNNLQPAGSAGYLCGQRTMYTKSTVRKTRWLKILVYTEKSTVSGQITTKVPYVESLEAYLHIHIFLDTVAATDAAWKYTKRRSWNLSLSNGQDHVTRERERESQTENKALMQKTCHSPSKRMVENKKA